MAEKALASIDEMQSFEYKKFMYQVNELAGLHDLQKYMTYSRVWEFPWAWFRLKPLQNRHLTLLDIGSEKSPFPWFLATQGFNVIISDVVPKYWQLWNHVKRNLKVEVNRRILDAEKIDLPTASIDVYLSISVLEHMKGKTKAIEEAARVLRPGGHIILTFDICEPGMGMSFPEWNGSAMTLQEFDDLFTSSEWFEQGVSDIRWNTEDILEYLSWHRTTASHHNYVTGAAVIRRNEKIWREPLFTDCWRRFVTKCPPLLTVWSWHLRNSIKPLKKRLTRVVDTLEKVSL